MAVAARLSPDLPLRAGGLLGELFWVWFSSANGLTDEGWVPLNERFRLRCPRRREKSHICFGAPALGVPERRSLNWPYSTESP
jgi:hypothetical protein